MPVARPLPKTVASPFSGLTMGLADTGEPAATVNNRAMVYKGTRHSVSEWHILRAAAPNLLITGVPDAVEQSLEALTPHLVPSVWYWPLGAPWPSPGGMRTLVIRDVQRLALADQQALSLWFDQGASMQTRVVSTATGVSVSVRGGRPLHGRVVLPPERIDVGYQGRSRSRATTTIDRGYVRSYRPSEGVLN
jgi:hypothetical protein